MLISGETARYELTRLNQYCLQKWVCLFIWVFLNVNPFHMQTHCDTYAADNFQKHCGKRKKCSWCFQVISIIAVSFIEIFHIFAQMFFSVVYCHFVIMKKRVNLSHIQQICSRRLWNYVENHSKCRYDPCKKVENIMAKVEIARFELFLLLS